MFTVSPQNMPDFASVILNKHSLRDRCDGIVSRQQILSLISVEKFQNVNRTYSIEEFIKESLETFKLQTIGKSKIFDFDLDYFVPGDTYFRILLNDNQIKETMNVILNLCEWDLITVALSPTSCGEEQNTRHLLNLFCEVSGIDHPIV